MNRSRTARAQTQAAGLAGKAPITFGLRFTFSSGRSSRLVERSRLRRSGYSRPNVEPKQLVPSSKASTTLGTEGNLELLAEEQVVHDEALTAADGGGECVEEELDEFEHRGRIADPRSRLDRRMVVCSPTGLLRAGSISDLATPGPLLSCPSGNQPVEAPEVVF